MKTRDHSIDLARFVGMVCVVLLHTSVTPEIVLTYFCAYFMPLFFVIAGILIDTRREWEAPYRTLILRRVRGLLLPYVIFQIPTLINSLRLQMRGDTSVPHGFLTDVTDVLTLKGASVFWFLPALFFSELIVLFLIRKMPYPAALLAAALLTAAGFVLRSPLLSRGAVLAHSMAEAGAFFALPYAAYALAHMLLRSCICAGFVAAGCLFSHMWLRIPAGTGIPLLLAGALISRHNGMSDLNGLFFGAHPALYLLSALFGSAGILLTCRLLSAFAQTPPMRLFSWYGRHSLILMMTHLDWYLVWLSLRILKMTPFPAAAYPPLTVILVFFLEIPVIFLLQKPLARLRGKLQ